MPEHMREEFIPILVRCTAGRRTVVEQDRGLMGSNALGLGECGHWVQTMVRTPPGILEMIPMDSASCW